MGGGGEAIIILRIVNHLLSLSFRCECTTMKSKRKAKFRAGRVVAAQWPNTICGVEKYVMLTGKPRATENPPEIFWQDTNGRTHKERFLRLLNRIEMGLPPRRKRGRQ